MVVATLVKPRNIRGDSTMNSNLRSIQSWTMLIVLVLAVTVFSAQPAQAAGVCPAPGTGWAGALNMILDPTMGAIMDAHTAAQGDAGMFLAVGKTACP
jgi:hypothetical protein